MYIIVSDDVPQPMLSLFFLLSSTVRRVCNNTENKKKTLAIILSLTFGALHSIARMRRHEVIHCRAFVSILCMRTMRTPIHLLLFVWLGMVYSSTMIRIGWCHGCQETGRKRGREGDIMIAVKAVSTIDFGSIVFAQKKQSHNPHLAY